MNQIKQQLYDLCLDYVNQRIETAQNTINGAQNSANEETKSSAGDKYETGRAMMQQEAEWGRRQLAEAQKLKQELDQVKVENLNEEGTTIHTGNLIHTNKGVFYLSISAGKLLLGDKTFFAISPVSPIGSKLLGQKQNDKFELNGQSFHILQVD